VFQAPEQPEHVLWLQVMAWLVLQVLLVLLLLLMLMMLMVLVLQVRLVLLALQVLMLMMVLHALMVLELSQTPWPVEASASSGGGASPCTELSICLHTGHML
jgi:hypothetical protein